MHNAPLVQYPVGRFAWAVWASAGLGLAAVLLSAYLLYLDQISLLWALFSFGLVSLVAAAWLHSGARRQVPAWLVWDGQGWQCWVDEEGQEALSVRSLSVQADFQQVMLLQLCWDSSASPAPRPEWLWLYKGFAPEKWHGLRCAVYSRLNP